MRDRTENRITDLLIRLDYYMPDNTNGYGPGVDNDVRRTLRFVEELSYRRIIPDAYADSILSVCEEWVGHMARQIDADREYDAWVTEQMYAAREHAS